jgi:hypothetical protein
MSLGGEDDGTMGLSPPVEAAVEEAVRLIDSLVGRLAAREEFSSAPLIAG